MNSVKTETVRFDDIEEVLSLLFSLRNKWLKFKDYMKRTNSCRV